MSNEFGYIPESPDQSFGNNKGIFTPTDIYDLTRADKYTNYGQLEHIQTQTVSGVSAVAFDNVFGDYNVHFLTFNNLSKDAGGGGYISMKFSADGGSSYTGNYQQALQMGEGEHFYSIRNLNYGSVRIGQHGDSTSEPNNGYCYLYNFTDSSKYTFTTHQSSNIINGGTNGMIFGSHAHTTAQANNYLEIKYYYSSANLTGTLSLYGIKEYS